MAETNSQESKENDVRTSLLLRNAHRELMKGVHTMMPGVIESFDPTTQRAKVNLANAQETSDGEKLSFPPLINVPIQFFRWGSFTISAPVNPGDECCVVFSERSMDLFLQLGQKDTVPNDIRFFDLSDAFALPALNSDPNIVPNYDPVNMVIKHDSDKVYIQLTPAGEMNTFTTEDTNITSLKDINLTSGNNAVKIKDTGGFSSTNTTAELITVINQLFQLIKTYEVDPEWSTTPKNLYAAELVKLASFLV